MTITPETIAELRRLEKVATKGPWEAVERGAYGDFDGNSRVIIADDMRVGVIQTNGEPDCEANADLTVAARNALPGLLDEVERLQKMITHETNMVMREQKANADLRRQLAEKDAEIERWKGFISRNVGVKAMTDSEREKRLQFERWYERHHNYSKRDRGMVCAAYWDDENNQYASKYIQGCFITFCALDGGAVSQDEKPAGLYRTPAKHGHVTPLPGGIKARCGGPAICRVCQSEQAALRQPQPSRERDLALIEAGWRAASGLEPTTENGFADILTAFQRSQGGE